MKTSHQWNNLAFTEAVLTCLVCVANGQLVSAEREVFGCGQLAVLPGNIDLEASSGSKAFDGSGRPGIGEGWE